MDSDFRTFFFFFFFAEANGILKYFTIIVAPRDLIFDTVRPIINCHLFFAVATGDLSNNRLHVIIQLSRTRESYKQRADSMQLVKISSNHGALR